MKEKLDVYVVNSDTYLRKIARTITKNDSDYDLYSEVLINIYENIETKNAFLKTNKDFEVYFKKNMNNLWKWRRMRCSEQKKDNNLFTYSSIEDITDSIRIGGSHDIDGGLFKFDMINLSTNKDAEIIELYAENIDKNTKKYIEYLINNDEKYIPSNFMSYIQECSNVLNDIELIIFEQHFIKFKTIREIFNEMNNTISIQYLYKIQRTCIEKLKIELKNKKIL